MKPSEILREAAQYIEEGSLNSGCTAIAQVYWDGRANNNDAQRAIAYFDLFRPEEKTRGAYWFGDRYVQANQDLRVIALCFAAAIAEEEGE